MRAENIRPKLPEMADRKVPAREKKWISEAWHRPLPNPFLVDLFIWQAKQDRKQGNEQGLDPRTGE